MKNVNVLFFPQNALTGEQPQQYQNLPCITVELMQYTISNHWVLVIYNTATRRVSSKMFSSDANWCLFVCSYCHLLYPGMNSILDVYWKVPLCILVLALLNQFLRIWPLGTMMDFVPFVCADIPSFFLGLIFCPLILRAGSHHYLAIFSSSVHLGSVDIS